MWEVGVAGSPVIGRRLGALSTLLRRPGLRASSDGVLPGFFSVLTQISTSCRPAVVHCPTR